MIRSLLLAAVAASLAACASTPPAAGGPQAPSGVCNAEGARWAIGSAVNDDVVNRILRDTGSRDARVGLAVSSRERAPNAFRQRRGQPPREQRQPDRREQQ